jgi:hypothetical protein
MFPIRIFGEKIFPWWSEIVPMRFFRPGLALIAILGLAPQRPVTIPNVRSGHAELIQKGRLTILELAPTKAPVQRIALTHPSDYQQGTNAPFKAQLIAESPSRFLIFTDSFDSNPGNPQGKCGASGPTEDDRTRERFVHVVALGNVPHETLSILVDSCLLDILAATTSPEWVAKTDRDGFGGKLSLRFEQGTQPTAVYYVASDGSVGRPQTKPNP